MPSTLLHTPLGTLLLKENRGVLTMCKWVEDCYFLPESEMAPSALLEEAKKQLCAYFSEGLKQFTLPIAYASTPFRETVWARLSEIPFGTTISYKTLAVRIGNPRACRAVAGACHHNPLAIIIPCHRIIGQDGSLTGYAGGIDVKRALLKLENADHFETDYLFGS